MNGTQEDEEATVGSERNDECFTPGKQHCSDSEFCSIDVPRITIDRALSKSMEDILLFQSHITANASKLSQNQRQRSMPLLDICGVDRLEYKSEFEFTCQDRANNKEKLEISKSSQITQEEEQQLKSTSGLKVPVGETRKDYDYVRASMILQRISNLKRHDKGSNSEALPDDFDSDSGYVIEYQEQDKELVQNLDTEDMHDSQNPYVQLVGTDEGRAETRDCICETEQTRQGSPRPPLHLREHPSIAESDNDLIDDDYEELDIYQELSGEAADYGEPHYDSIHQMRERVTQLVRGKHRKKLKKYIIKRKSSERLATGETSLKLSHGLSPDDCVVSNPINIESESDSSEEDEVIHSPKMSSKLEQGGNNFVVSGTSSKVTTAHPKKKTVKHRLLRRSHTCKTQRLSQHRSELLDTVQYDQMLKVMLNDRDVKQLQDAGAVKIKDISELRAEIKELVQSAPSLPPPLPGDGRPRDHKKKRLKKWSSKSFHRVLS